MHKQIKDAIDRNLIALLQEDARVSATELGRKLGVARTTVNERIARLERDQIIIGYSAIVRLNDVEASCRAVLSINCERERSKKLFSALRDLPEITSCHAVSGQYDIMCYAETPCTEDLSELIDEIYMLPGINKIDSTIILETKFCRATDLIAARQSNLALVS